MSVAERLAAALSDRYRLERELGQGGMATVYLAADLKHDRKVAIKVLKPDLAAVLGAERFITEIKTTAALSHPHILPLFDSGTAGQGGGGSEFLYYVMPYIEGETIRDKLTREGQFGIEEAVRIAREVADALDYAHRHGVIHRDIKPENILLHDGRAMVMDFGIALAVSAAAGGRMTETGLSLGTPHYMSPEQATADKQITGRSDIYSLASVLFEMLTGEPPHMGNSAQQVIMKIIADTPRPAGELRKSIPPNLSAALARALEKLPADRFESARAFGDALADEGFHYAAGTPGRGTTAVGATRPAAASRAPLLVLGAVAALALGAAAWALTRPVPEPPVVRLDLAFGDIEPDPYGDVVISPDGTTLAFSGRQNGERAIWIRRIEDADFTSLEGTIGGSDPSFSPDSRWLVFSRNSDEALVKVSTAGGGVITLHSGGDPRPVFPHWGTDDWIVFSGPTGLFRIPATGGAPERVQGGGSTQFLLPDGSGGLHAQNNNVAFTDFATDSSRVLVPNARHPSYLATGHLVYVAEDGGLFAVPFDLGRHEVTGPPVRVLDRVAATGVRSGYSISRDGVLVHHEGTADLTGAQARRFVIIDLETGAADTLRLPSGNVSHQRFSPNGRMLAYFRGGQGIQGGLFTFDLVSGTNTQITSEGRTTYPVWSPDGTRLAYAAQDVEGADGADLYVKPVDNSGEARQLLSRPGDQDPTGWLADGTILVNSFVGNNADLLTLPAEGGGDPVTYLEAPWAEYDLTVSPDGILGAFTSQEMGRGDIWIRNFPVAEGKWRVTTNGPGYLARWSPDGDYVYFVRFGAPADSLFRVRVDRAPGGVPVIRGEELVITVDIAGSFWDLHPDGRRVVVAVAEEAPSPGGTTQTGTDRYLVVLNWFREMLGRIGQQDPR